MTPQCIPFVMRGSRGWLTIGDPTHCMKVGAIRIYFEFSDRFGPMRCTKDGAGTKSDFPKAFWPLFDEWLKRRNAKELCQCLICAKATP